MGVKDEHMGKWTNRHQCLPSYSPLIRDASMMAITLYLLHAICEFVQFAICIVQFG